MADTCHLWRLPAELRIHIYELVYEAPLKPEASQLLEPFPPTKALLLTCHQLRKEAGPVYEQAYQRPWIERYREVAESVNRRELARFIEDIRSKWNPDPGSPHVWHPDYHADGWTEAGAFALCVWQLAFRDFEPDRDGVLCEAEERNQILLHPPIEAFVDEISGPLYDPLPWSEVDEHLERIRMKLQQQVDNLISSDTITVELPTDFVDLMHKTNGINAAGVPSETDWTFLVHHLRKHIVTAEVPRRAIPSYLQKQYEPLAAWNIGGCAQYRDIWYVLCRNLQNASIGITWQVVNRWDVDFTIFDNLAQFLQFESQLVENRPGGAQQIEVIYLPTYP